MTIEEAKQIVKSECYIADLLNLDRTQMVNTALDTVIEAAEKYAKIDNQTDIQSVEEDRGKPQLMTS